MATFAVTNAVPGSNASSSSASTSSAPLIEALVAAADTPVSAEEDMSSEDRDDIAVFLRKFLIPLRFRFKESVFVQGIKLR